jgi:hypothetical protein
VVGRVNRPEPLEQTERMLGACLDFAQRCDRVYAAAPTRLRRQMNQAMFEKFYLDDDGEVTAELAGPFKVLLDPRLLGTELIALLSNPAVDSEIGQVLQIAAAGESY